jgi:hypothetical protein
MPISYVLMQPPTVTSQLNLPDRSMITPTNAAGQFLINPTFVSALIAAGWQIVVSTRHHARPMKLRTRAVFRGPRATWRPRDDPRGRLFFELRCPSSRLCLHAGVRRPRGGPASPSVAASIPFERAQASFVAREPIADVPIGSRALFTR